MFAAFLVLILIVFFFFFVPSVFLMNEDVYIRCMWIFAGILLGGVSNESGVVENGNFWGIRVANSSETSEIRPKEDGPP